MKAFQEACLYGIPDEVGVRPSAWKVLLGYLPPDKRMWQSTLSSQRLCYYNLVRDLLEEPGGEPPSRDHPLCEDPNSKWATYFHDNTFLDQIDKDIRRTLPDFAFFQLHVPQNPQNPLSAPPRPEKEDLSQKAEQEIGDLLAADRPMSAHRFSFGLMGRPRSSSAASKKSPKTTTVDTRARSNSKSSLRSFSSSNFGDMNPDKLSAPRSIVRKLSSAFKSSPSPMTQKSKKLEPPAKTAICPYVTNRRTLFKRVVHLNNEFGGQDPSETTKQMALVGDVYTPDFHWEAIERLLFVYAKLNPGVGYVQGMNELLAPIYYVFSKDPNLDEQAHAEADAFFVFTNLMSDVRDHFVRSLDHDTNTGINATMMRMSQRFKWVDQALWRDLNKKDVKEQYYAFRWITVLCSQEWDLPDVIRLWDSILADRNRQDVNIDDSRFEFLLDFSVAMLTCVRQELLQGDFGDNVRNYPIDDIQVVLKTAYSIRDMRLQAIASGQVVPGVNEQRGSGFFSSDWSDTSSISSNSSGNRLQRLRDSTGIARASFESFRRDSKESIDELFKKGMAITRENPTDIWKRASTGDVTRSLSQRLKFNGLASKVKRSGSVNTTRSANYSSPDLKQAGMANEFDVPASTRLGRKTSSLLNRFSQIMVSNTSIPPYGSNSDNQDRRMEYERPQSATPHSPNEAEDEKRIFAKAVSVRDEILGRNSQQSYHGFV
ncbi:rab-GTPase-TBC domain-containing protein [Phycomyces nitens]|nr:rab-GTPase-TBC domain-containing protein [Phycomyces nitens]